VSPSGMPPPVSPDEAFERGMACLEQKNHREAAYFFQMAIEMEKKSNARTRQVKFVSYLGLALTLSRDRMDEALRLCEQAVEHDFLDPDIMCNFGIACLRNLQRARAFEAFHRGLAMRPNHPRIIAELERYERRSAPVFAFLPRSHVLNRLAGKLRARLRYFFDREAAVGA
jgi:tetratricopeptide (TPR) repeat protein